MLINLLLYIYTGFSLATHGLTHTVSSGQAMGSILNTTITRLLNPNARLSSFTRKIINDEYPLHKSNPEEHQHHGYLFYRLFVFTFGYFEDIKTISMKTKITQFEEEYSLYCKNDSRHYKNLEFASPESLKKFIRVLKQYPKNLKMVENECNKLMDMMHRLDNKFSIEIQNGVMRELKGVKWCNDNQYWININDENDIIHETDDWYDGSTIFSNDFDKLSTIVKVSNEKQKDANNSENIEDPNDLDNR